MTRFPILGDDAGNRFAGRGLGFTSPGCFAFAAGILSGLGFVVQSYSDAKRWQDRRWFMAAADRND